MEPEDWELLWLRAKLGEVMMRLELAEGLIEKKLLGGVEDEQAMRQQRSPRTRRRYPLTMICQMYRLARSTVYAAMSGPAARVRQKRGPKTAWTDAVVLETNDGTRFYTIQDG